MAAVVDRADARRARERYLDSLLEELAERRRQLYRLRTAGTQPAGLRDLKREFEVLQRRLAEAVGRGGA